MKTKICIVCSGNICRSPFVEYVLKRELDNNFNVYSIGLLRIWDQPAYEVCVAAAPNFGVDLTPHRSKGVTSEIIQISDYILAMTKTHIKGINMYLPKGKVHLLSEFLPENEVYNLGILGQIKNGDDIPDPMGRDMFVVEPVLEILEKASVNFANQVKSQRNSE